MGSYDETLRRSEAGLKLALQQLGIPINTSFSINSNTSDGRIKVVGEFPCADALEDLINGNMDLRNVLAASSGNALLSMTVAVAQQGMAATRADPAHADAYNAWIVDMSRQVQSTQVLFRYAGQRLAGHMAGPDGAVVRVLDAVPRPKG